MCRLGQWSGGVVAMLSLIYLGMLSSMMVAGLPFPPAEPYTTGFHVLILATVLAMVPLWCAIHLAAPPDRRIFTLTSLVFVAMLVLLVTINRFVALTLVRQSPGLGRTEGLDWFQPYGWPSLMFTFESLGWGIFFSLACLFLVPVFRTGKLARWIGGSFLVVGVLSPAAAIGLYLNSIELMGLVAPVAWGVGLILATALVARWFKPATQKPTLVE
ncbi:hypothetical protein OG474_13650 [Kribbella sp. NBC_01505]|uniref:hypothetical protein n=1 Tax=Kribbella sp. NBC_01505 TaxID=2903580 RepID=UPI003868B53D